MTFIDNPVSYSPELEARGQTLLSVVVLTSLLLQRLGLGASEVSSQKEPGCWGDGEKRKDKGASKCHQEGAI